MEIKGGCLCGAVRYNARAEPAFVGICHCRDCQKVHRKRFRHAPRAAAICPECGSSIAEAPSTRPGMLILNAGTLDDPTSVTPQFELYCERTLPWVQLA